MISDYSGTGDEAPTLGQVARRPDAIGMFQPFASFLLAAGFMLSLAGCYESQLIRAERIQQEVIGR